MENLTVKCYATGEIVSSLVHLQELSQGSAHQFFLILSMN